MVSKFTNMGKHIYREEKIGDHILRVVDDPNPYNPRENDNLTTMVCFHGRYTLGDKNHGYKHNDYNSWAELKQAIVKKEKPVAILPIYLYDHSGITISTSPFSCKWDSGQIGFVFITPKTMKENWKDWKKWEFSAIEEKTNTIIQGEIEEYDKYLRGEAYGYEIYRLVLDVEDDFHEKFVDNCFGYNTEEDALNDGRQAANFTNAMV